MSSKQPLTKKLSNTLERFPWLWRIANKLYGFHKFDPNRLHYKKQLSAEALPADISQPDILIDGQCLQTLTRQRGIGKYTIKFIHALAEQSPERNIWVFFTNITRQENIDLANQLINNPSLKNLQTFTIDVFNADNTTSISKAIENLSSKIESMNPKTLLMPSAFEKSRNVVPVTAISNILNVALLHDLIPLEFSKNLLTSNFSRSYYMWRLEGIKRFNLVLANSKTTAIAWHKFVGPHPPVKVIYGASGFTHVFAPTQVDVVREGFLVVTAEQKHKNTKLAIKAYCALSENIQKTHDLTIIGVRSEGHRKLLKTIGKSAKGKIHIPEYVSDKQLQYLYIKSKLLIIPSLSEGLSMPIFEAWSFGLVAIGACGTVAEEVIQSKTALFDPRSIDSLKNCILNLINSENIWNIELQKLNSRKLEFDWNKAAVSALNEIEEAQFQVNSRRALLIGTRTALSSFESGASLRINTITKLLIQHGFEVTLRNNFTFETKQNIQWDLIAVVSYSSANALKKVRNQTDFLWFDPTDSWTLSRWSMIKFGSLDHLPALIRDSWFVWTAPKLDLITFISSRDKNKEVLWWKNRIEPYVIPNVELKREVLPSMGIRLVFIGDGHYAPNAQAVNFLEKLQVLDPHLPPIHVYGKGYSVKKNSKIVFHGYQDSANMYYRDDIHVLPIFSGAGIKNKVVIALESGLRVITTREGANGIGWNPLLSVVATEREFITAIKENSLFGDVEESGSQIRYFEDQTQQLKEDLAHKFSTY